MLLEVKDLTITLEAAQPVEGLRLSLDRGKKLGLIGDSGSGKSLVLMAVAGLLPPGAVASGAMRFDDAPFPTDPRALRALRQTRMGAVMQGDPIVSDPLARIGDRIADAALVAELGLDPHRLLSDLGAADRQLLLIGEALAKKPDLMLLDEPFLPLDAPTEKRIVALLARQPMAMLVASHDLPALAAMVDDILVLGEGKRVESGAAREIFSRPTEDYSKRLIAGSRARARTLMRSPIGTELLEVQGVSVVYPDRERLVRRRPPVVALDNVTFELRRGEALAVVGATGAGKTTLARLVAGLGRANKGVLAFERQPYRGRDLPSLLRADISLVFSDPRRAFSSRMTLGASVTEPLLLDQTHTIEEQTDRLMDVLTGVGLSPDHLTLQAAALPLYELQLLALARALITRPRLVVLDEPVRLLNARQRIDMIQHINRLRADFGFSALITSSSLELIRHVADRAIVLDRGRIVDEGTPGAILETPRHPASRAMSEARLPEVGIGVVAPAGW